MIKVKNLSKTYKLNKDVTIKALQEINMSIHAGDFVAIIGNSGSGKTTLLNILAGLDRTFDGDIIINNKNIKDYNANDYRRNIASIIFQQFNLINHLSVEENILLPSKFYKKYKKDETRKRLNYLLESVGLSNRKKHKPSELSGGQAQRVAIARALFNNPQLLLADEPTGNLDSKTGEQIINLLKEINNVEKTTIIVATHNQDILKYANKIFRLKDGKIDNV